MKLQKLIAGLFALLTAVTPVGGATMAAFHFNQAGSSSTVSDVSGNNHDAVFNRPVSANADNPFGEDYSLALSINPTTAKLSNPQSINLREGSGGDSSFTLEGWIKPSIIGHMVFIQLVTNDGLNTIQLALTSDGMVEARLRTNGAATVRATSQTAVSVSEWSHLALIYSDGEGKLSVFVNAVEVASQQVSNVSIPAAFDTISFGGDGTNQVKGLIADIRISDIALAAEELGFHAPIPEPSSVAFIAVSLVALGLLRTKIFKI